MAIPPNPPTEEDPALAGPGRRIRLANNHICRKARWLVVVSTVHRARKTLSSHRDMLRFFCVAAALLPLCLSVPVALPSAHSKEGMGAAMGHGGAPLAFDYLHLVQEWPGSFCDTKKGCKWPAVEPINGWLLHGLWPEFNNGSWPQYCDPGAPFNMSAIEDMLPELQKYWPSLVSPDQASFWAHEWTRHGTCCEGLTPQEHDYFRLVLTLRERFDVHLILNGVGIVPEGSTSWREVKKALEAVTGHAVEVGCNFDATGKRQLYEVRSCYTPTAGMNVVQTDCPGEKDFKSCGDPDGPIFLPIEHGKSRKVQALERLERKSKA